MIELISMFLTAMLAIKIAQWMVRLTTRLKPEWFEEQEEKPKRKNDDLETDVPPAVSHFELGDDGELIEVFEEER